MYRLFFLIVLFLFNKPIFAVENEIKFGIVPQQSADKLLAVWAPLIKKLSQSCKCNIVFYTTPDIPLFFEKVKNGEYDLVYLNPDHFINSIKYGYHSLVREKDKKLQGILVVSKNSGIKNISELKNQKITFPSPTSFAATVLNQNELNEKKIKFEPVYVGSHESVYLNVTTGLAKAGGGITRTFESLPNEEKEKLVIISKTAQVTPHPIAIHSRIESSLKSKILQGLIELDQSDEGKTILKNLNLNNFIPAKDSDWNDVKKIAEQISTKND